MKFELRQRDRRALIMLVLGVGLFALADMLVLPAYDRLAASRELAAEKETQLRRYRRAELRKGQYTNLLKVADDRLLKSETVVIAAANASLASAELQSLVEGAGNKVGLMLGQRLVGAPRRVNNFYAELPMTLSFDSTPGQLITFLNELRSLPRFVNVRTLQINPVSPVMEAPKGADLMKNVHVNMAISTLAPVELVKQEGTVR